jgi:hypothetical protein
MDFKNCAERLREQQRRESAKTQERLQEQARQRERARAVQRSAEQRRARAQREREEEEERQEAERSANSGVLWRTELQACPLGHMSPAEARRRRAINKCVLPPSAKTQLLEEQGAMRNGPVFVLLREPSSQHTCYCGVLEFDAPEGQIMLPEWAQAQLGGICRAARGGREWSHVNGVTIDVSYRSLPKGKRATLQPVSPSFQHETEDPREVLEQQLNRMSCLAEGEVVELPESGHRLVVRTVEPAPAVSLMDTDLEVIVEQSAASEAEQQSRIGSTLSEGSEVSLAGDLRQSHRR